jgi:hypothetical protein
MRALRFLSVLPKILFVALLAAVPLVDSARAQKPDTSPLEYDVKSEAKFKGTVEELKLPPKGNAKDAAHLLVKMGADTVDVYLCPGPFLEDMGVTFKKGDEISLTGSKVKQDASEMILAREVVKGTDALVLRDDTGAPIWNWRK